MAELHPLIQIALVIFGPAGAAFLSVKHALNGTREDVREIKSDVKALSVTVTDIGTRVTVLEDRDER